MFINLPLLEFYYQSSGCLLTSLLWAGILRAESILLGFLHFQEWECQPGNFITFGYLTGFPHHIVDNALLSRGPFLKYFLTVLYII